MSHIKITFDIYDPRYRTEPDRATCFEAGCETLNEARKAAKQYGQNNVIVRTVLEQVYGSVWRVVSSEIQQ